MGESTENKLDKEWVVLMLLAKKMGMSIEEIRDFINKEPISLLQQS